MGQKCIRLRCCYPFFNIVNSNNNSELSDQIEKSMAAKLFGADKQAMLPNVTD